MAEAPHIAVHISMPRGSSAESEDTDRLSALLFEHGALGLEIQDAAEPLTVIAAFSGEEARRLEGELSAALEAEGIAFDDLRSSAFERVDWSTQWKEGLGPLRFGALWVVPSWLEVPKGARYVLRIDPSMAFGTGLHETTALTIERIVELSPVPSLLDVGTGSGILALAALALGAKEALGIDIDPIALEIARENANKNALSDRLALSPEPLDGIARTFSLVVANILAGTLVELAPALARMVSPGGALLLSGILVSQADDVRAAYESRRFAHVTTRTRGEWAMIEMKAPSRLSA